MNELKLFESQYIRSVWNPDEEQWYYSVIDVIAALTDSSDPRNYWKVLKSRLKKEGNETVTNCNRLKLQAADGKMRLTDVANTEELLRIIQSVPSPKAEPFKLWLAQTGADHLLDLADAKKCKKKSTRGYGLAMTSANIINRWRRRPKMPAFRQIKNLQDSRTAVIWGCTMEKQQPPLSDARD